jgi:hypothetical protein
MFRKLVSNLPYSPALIADIGFYANRLRDEEVTRRMTVLFVVLALMMQSLAVFSPPESANASSEQDIIRGGVTDLNDFLLRYDHNEDDIKDIYNAAGVSRSEISAMRPGVITTSDNTYIMSRFGQLSTSDKEVVMSYQRSVGGVGVRYFSPLSETASMNVRFDGWIGNSSNLGWFGIIQANGSLATHGIPATINTGDNSKVAASRTVRGINLSQDSAAIEKTTAKPLDRISYTLVQSNPRDTSATADFNVRIADLLEYATIIDNGGATLDNKSGTLSWSRVQLPPGTSQERTFVVQILSDIPATSHGNSDPSSYDCKMTVVFGNKLSAPVDCPAPKIIESLFTLLPPADMGLNIAFGTAVLSTATYFYIRTRQLKKEIRVIRHNFNTGSL